MRKSLIINHKTPKVSFKIHKNFIFLKFQTLVNVLFLQQVPHHIFLPTIPENHLNILSIQYQKITQNWCDETWWKITYHFLPLTLSISNQIFPFQFPDSSYIIEITNKYWFTNAIDTPNGCFFDGISEKDMGILQGKNYL